MQLGRQDPQVGHSRRPDPTQTRGSVNSLRSLCSQYLVLFCADSVLVVLVGQFRNIGELRVPLVVLDGLNMG